MKTERCKKCGHCCILHSTICLTPKEVYLNKYETRKRPLDDDIILKRKIVFIPELKRKMRVCWYFNPENNKCLIHKDKPRACQREFCGGTQYKKEWES